MRKYLLATTAAVIALTFSSRVFLPKPTARYSRRTLLKNRAEVRELAVLPPRIKPPGPSLVPSGSN